jgi:hypothetical protein
MNPRYHKNYARAIIKWGEVQVQPETMTVADIIAIEKLVLYPIKLELLDEIIDAYGLVCPVIKTALNANHWNAVIEGYRLANAPVSYI